jgi:hypothetical protein
VDQGYGRARVDAAIRCSLRSSAYALVDVASERVAAAFPAAKPDETAASARRPTGPIQSPATNAFAAPSTTTSGLPPRPTARRTRRSVRNDHAMEVPLVDGRHTGAVRELEVFAELGFRLGGRCGVGVIDVLHRADQDTIAKPSRRAVRRQVERSIDAEYDWGVRLAIEDDIEDRGVGRGSSAMLEVDRVDAEQVRCDAGPPAATITDLASTAVSPT